MPELKEPDDPLYHVMKADGLISDEPWQSPLDALNKQIHKDLEGILAQKLEENEPQTPPDAKNTPIYRLDSGLIEGLEYKYKDGFIDWEAMFNPEYAIYPNNDSTKEPLFKVDGLKDLARIRGVSSKTINFQGVSETMVICAVTMKFIPNDEYPFGQEVTALADATPKNVGGKQFSKYLSAMAETRATGRCIKDALNIKRCTFEELSKDDADIQDDVPISDEAIVAIEQQMKIKGIDLDVLLKEIQKRHPHIVSIKDMSAHEGTDTLKWLAKKINTETK